jgi:hypothetical protein
LHGEDKVNSIQEYKIHASRAVFIPDDKTVSQGSNSTTLRYTITEDLKNNNDGLNKDCLAQPWYL